MFVCVSVEMSASLAAFERPRPGASNTVMFTFGGNQSDSTIFLFNVCVLEKSDFELIQITVNGNLSLRKILWFLNGVDLLPELGAVGLICVCVGFVENVAKRVKEAEYGLWGLISFLRVLSWMRRECWCNGWSHCLVIRRSWCSNSEIGLLQLGSGESDPSQTLHDRSIIAPGCPF